MASNNSQGSSRSGSARNRSSSQRQSDRTSGVMELARERPVAAAAVAAGAAAAGLFLWSKRSQISNQLGSLSDQIGEWTENFASGAAGLLESGDDTGGLTSGKANAQRPRRARTTSKTGSGNASPRRSIGRGATLPNRSGNGDQASVPADE